jgi:mono/diheme cytochrome c family protein
MLEKLYHFLMIIEIRVKAIATVIAIAGTAGAVAVMLASAPEASPMQRQGSGWTLPPDAADTKNPLTVDDKVLATGKKIFSDKCQKCHGEKGLGDGPDADPDHAEEQNLTNPKRADRNPDGVVFYKVSNGRRSPKMPTFKDELSKEQIWSVVAYVQTLRKK